MPSSTPTDSRSPWTASETQASLPRRGWGSSSNSAQCRARSPPHIPTETDRRFPVRGAGHSRAIADAGVSDCRRRYQAASRRRASVAMGDGASLSSLARDDGGMATCALLIVVAASLLIGCGGEDDAATTGPAAGSWAAATTAVIRTDVAAAADSSSTPPSSDAATSSPETTSSDAVEHPERFDAKQIEVSPAGNAGLRIREVVDQDFGSFDRHGYQRIIPNDFGVPTHIAARSPDAPADVSVDRPAMTRPGSGSATQPRRSRGSTATC